MIMRDMSPKTFKDFQDLLAKELGMRFSPKKKQMLQSKIRKIMHNYEIET